MGNITLNHFTYHTQGRVAGAVEKFLLKLQWFSVNQASLIQQLRDRHLIPQAKTTLIAHPPAPTELPGLQLLHDGFYKILSVRSRAS